MSHQAAERAAALIVRCQPTLLPSRCERRRRCDGASPSYQHLPPLTLARFRLQTFLGHYRRDAAKCDELCQELMALPDTALEACLPQIW